MIDAAIVHVLRCSNRVRKGKTTRSVRQTVKWICTGSSLWPESVAVRVCPLWVARASQIRSSGRIRSQDLLSKRSASSLHEGQSCARGFKVVCGGEPLKQLIPVNCDEKESLVLPDRTTNSAAKLVFDVFRLLR